MIAKKIIASAGIDVFAFAQEIGGIACETFDRDVIEQNIVRAADPVAAEKMIDAILQAKEEKDSLGGIVEIRALNMPPGLGEPTFDKLDALIGQAMLSVPATKGVEIGRGFAQARMRGSQSNDPFLLDGDQVRIGENNAGGTLGGISTGEDVIVRVAVKPTSSIEREQDTVTKNLDPEKIIVYGRHDPSVVPRAVPVLEAMLALVLADLVLQNRSARIEW